MNRKPPAIEVETKENHYAVQPYLVHCFVAIWSKSNARCNDARSFVCVHGVENTREFLLLCAKLQTVYSVLLAGIVLNANNCLRKF